MADASSCPPPTEQCELPEGPSTLSEERSSANEAIVPVPPPVDASIARPSATEVRRPPATHYSSDAIRNGPVPRIPNGCIRRPPLFGTGMPRGFIGDGSHMYDHVRHPNWHGPSPWGFNGWPSPMQVLPGVRPWPFFHPPIPPGPFMNPPCPAPFPPLAAPMRFPEVFHHGHCVPPRPMPPQPFRSQPFRTPQPSSSSFLPENLRTSLLKQIEYYFSVENLCKDIYLRRMMDEQGWVPVSLIASFNRVKMITGDVQCILDVLRSSTVVELMGDRIRKREDWERWVLIPQEDQQMESFHFGMKRLRIN